MFNRIPGLKIYRMADAGAGEGGAGAGAGTGEKPWFEPLDAEAKGYITTRGLDKKTPVEAFAEAFKAHREAEKFIGAPANEMIRLPKEANAPEWDGVWKRLGKPGEAKEYDFTAVKRAGDKPIDDALADTLRQAAFNANLSKEAATRLAGDVIKHLDSNDAATAATAADKLATEKRELEKNWGNNIAANKVVAEAAAKALGVDPSAVSALEKVIGYAKVMEMFRTIGTKIGEDSFIMSPNGGGTDGIMTRDQATAEKNALKADKDWVKRYLNNGVEERRKMEALDRIITGVK